MFTVSESDTDQFNSRGKNYVGRNDPNYDPKTHRAQPPEMCDRDVIAWDMEGISLSGQHKPQHAVLFGCSQVSDNALESQKLSTRDMLEHIISVGADNPYAIHVGFAFNYDANMIIAGLGENKIVKLWRTGSVRFVFGDGYVWSIKWIPSKFFTVTKRWGERQNSRAKTSVTIFDYSTFFGGKSFLKTAEEILADDISDSDRETIEHGKAARGNQEWDDMPSIRYYWEREIQLIRRVFEKFRDVMYRAGFKLKQWYGPGALANYINALHEIKPHLAGVQTTEDIMPNAVHEASKRAFAGGRFEMFKGGYVEGPIYAVDINSAYPHALTQVPSLSAESGQWRHVRNPDSVERFGFYRIAYQSGKGPLVHRPQPLFWRDARGMVSFPSMAHGWYASPEAAIARHVNGAHIREGWIWDCDTDTVEYPWTFLRDMYDTRARLGKQNLLSMPFKLGPNSLYGKYAQTKGWNEDENLPPKWHALPLAAWITSYTRAMLFNLMAQVPQHHLISVETDSVFMTCDPSTLSLSIGDALGQWDVTTYDAMMITQNGMYHVKKDSEWISTKSRGMNSTEYTVDAVSEYLKDCKPHSEWPSLALTTKPKFIGAGFALAASEPTKSLHTAWRRQHKEIRLGETGKRRHVPKLCRACKQGYTAYEMPHDMVSVSKSDGDALSAPRALPWEQEHTPEVQEIRDNVLAESSLIGETR